MEKTYVYKHFNSLGYVGVIDNVVSEFKLPQELNTSGTQIDVELGISFQGLAPSVEADTLITEDGDDIVTEGLDEIATRLDYVVSGIPSLNDRIEVWEYDDFNPNGVKRFDGLVFEYSANYLSSTTKITCVSYGIELDNHLVQILPEETATEYTFDNEDARVTLSPQTGKEPVGRTVGVAQTFQVGSDLDIQSVYVKIENPNPPQNPIRVLLSLVAGDPTSPGSTLATVERTINGNTPATQYEFKFSTPVSIEGSTTYHFTVFNNYFGLGDQGVNISYDSGGGYANGQLYQYNDSTGYAAPSGDLCFNITTSTGAIGNQFNSYEPSNIVRELIDTFQALGGQISYTAESIQNTNTVVSYTFKFNTFLDALKKCVELAPANWYYYIDPASGVLYFKEKSQTADHTFMLGRDLLDFNIKYSLDNVKNKVYFTGGDVAGDNLVTYSANESSVERYGAWLDLPSDNRVTLEDTADIISLSILNQNGVPKFSASAVVNAKNYNVSTVSPGETVSFLNMNTLVGSLKLQIMKITHSPDSANMELEILPPTVSKRIEDIRRNLKLQQTENNANDV